MIHAFQGCELDEELFQLRRRGAVVKLEPRSFDVLLYLLRHRDRVVEKEELLREVWPDTAVTESVLPTCVAAVRRAVGDQRARGKVIQTVHGRGYRFVAAVDEKVAVATSPAAPTSPFVGREPAMQRLRAGLASALAGRGRLLLLVGEPGIGKTRTAEEFAEQARSSGARVYTGRCHEGEGAPVFWPWIRALRELVDDFDRDALAADLGPGAPEIAALVPELGEGLAGLAPAPVADEEASRFRLFDSVTRFLRRASARCPLVLILDDLHWADEASLRLLRFLAAELSDARLLVVGTYRDVEVRRGLPLADVLGALAREPHCERVLLRGLEAPDVARFVASRLGDQAGDRLGDTVWEMTEGNPFFIHEVVGLLASQEDAAARELPGNAALSLPQSVRDAIGRRLDALSRDCDRLLRVASVLGREFSTALLERVAELPHRRTLELIDEALGAGVVVESVDGVGSFAFHHALVRQTLYDEIEIPERVHLHRRVGEALEEACGTRVEPHLPELAHHFFQAAAGGSSDEAVRYCALAAEHARGSLAYEEAARLFERALQALELRVPIDEERRGELLLAHGEACWLSGDRARAHVSFGATAEIARQLGNVTLLARAAASTRLYDMGSPPEGATRELMEEALAALGDQHPGLRSRLLSRLVTMPPYSDSMERRGALSREAHALAVRDGDDEALRDALLARSYACVGPDRIEDRFEVARELFALAEGSGDLGLAGIGQDVLHGAHLRRGEMAEADRALAAYARIARELRHPVFLYYALVWQGSRALARAAFDEAERLIREAYERGRGVQGFANFVFAGQMFLLRNERGDVDDSQEERIFFGEMMELPYAWVPSIRVSQAHRHVYDGEEERARRMLEKLAGEVRDLPHDEHWLQTTASTGELAAALGEERHGAFVYELLEPYRDLFLIHDILRSTGGSVAGVLGSLASLLGRNDQAASHFEDAIARSEAAGAPVPVLESKADFACHLLGRGRSAERARGVALGDEVRAGCERHGVSSNRRLHRALGKIAALSRNS